MASKRDYYEVLGVGKDAGAEDIKKAYRKQAMQYHPDRNAGDADAEAMFKEASEAYQVLSDGERRQRYDRYGHAGLEGMGVSPFAGAQSMSDFFNDILANVFGEPTVGRGGGRRGHDLEMTVEIELTEAARGVKKTLTIPREELCTDCNGSGARRGTSPATCRRCNGHGAVLVNQSFFRVQQTCRACGGRGAVIADPCPSCQGRSRVVVRRTLDVSVPPGVDSGDRLRVPGEGEAGAPGAARGDLHCLLRVREHALFHRDGPNLICQVPIAFSQAALGGDIEVPTLDGRTIYAVKGGTQSGDVVRIFGQGMPNVRGGRPGDLLVQLIVETPKQLTKRQEELFRELAELEQKHVSPQRKSFLEKVRNFFSAQPEPKP